MKLLQLSAAVAVTVILQTSFASAWFDEGHMRVAAIAYDWLTPKARTEVAKLIRRNPRYGEWAAAVPPNADGSVGDVDRYSFVRAAVWADDIKGYTSFDNDKVTSATAGQVTGYGDSLVHAYWHYKDRNFTTDGSSLPPADPVDAVTQINKLVGALSDTRLSADIRSYSLVWLLHLVGDAHQPLHAVALYTRDLTALHQAKGEPDTGDRGGNLITVVPANGEAINLHQYWDGLFGGYSTVYGALFDTFGRNPKKDAKGHLMPSSGPWPPSTTEAAILDPQVWFSESADLAQKYAYAVPVSATSSAQLTREYETNARSVAEGQTALAGARLANLINAIFQ